MTATDLAPLEDPAYDPVHKPVDGKPPDVVEKWGPRSQLRWFARFQGQFRMSHKEWARFYVESERHRGLCCPSCIEDVNEGYELYDPDRCCHKAEDT